MRETAGERAEAMDLKEWRQTKLKGLFLQNCETAGILYSYISPAGFYVFEKLSFL